MTDWLVLTDPTPRTVPTHAPWRGSPSTTMANCWSAASHCLSWLRAALPAAVKLRYAMEANPMPAVVRFMAGRVEGIDVASAGELKVALDAGANPSEVSFAGPGKRDPEPVQAVAAGVLVNVESMRELPLLAAAAQRLGLPARMAVRVNPDFELKCSGMKMGAGFGIPYFPGETPLDLLASRMAMPRGDVGDLAVVFQSGAYGASSSPHGFLGHPAVVEVLV